ncbi:hypothetical protein D9M73_177970 [compost metagenome]
MLAVNIVELGEVVAAGDAVGELVVEPAQGQVVSAEAATEAAVLVVQRQVFPVGVVAVLGLVQAATGEGQALDLFGGEQAALEGLRQDTPVVGLQGRQFGDQGADLEFSLGDLHLAGQAQLGVFVGSLAVIVGRQQAAVGTVGAGVELDAEHAQCVQAKAHGAIGVARLEIEDEALGPFIALGLLRAGAVAEVAVEVHVAGFEGGRAVFEEGGLAQRCDAGKGEGTGNCGLARR